MSTDAEVLVSSRITHHVSLLRWEGAGSRSARCRLPKPEDLLRISHTFPRGLGRGLRKAAGAILRVSALGIFYLSRIHLSLPGVPAGILLMVLLLSGTVPAEDQRNESDMKRRQQGILTGMPFMAHVSQRSFVDDLGRRMYLAKPPARIISLAPSVTEMLFALGAGESVVGVTEFCDYPPEAQSKPKVGYARPNLESLVALRPDLILAPQDFLQPDILTKLDELKIAVFVLQAASIEDVITQANTMGRMLERVSTANDVVGVMRQQLSEIKARVSTTPRRRVLYVLNSEPLITVGPGSFIHQMLELAGGANVAAASEVPYPRLNMEEVLKRDPEILLFPVGQAETVTDQEQQTWQRWTTLTAVKEHRFANVPTDLVNRPGPRITEGLHALAQAIHPEVFESVGR
jgi:iron complex transport system substrate-binding protein